MSSRRASLLIVAEIRAFESMRRDGMLPRGEKTSGSLRIYFLEFISWELISWAVINIKGRMTPVGIVSEGQKTCELGSPTIFVNIVRSRARSCIDALVR